MKGTSLLIPPELLLQSMGIHQVAIDVDLLPDTLDADRPGVDACEAGVGSRISQSGHFEFAAGADTATPIPTKSRTGPKLIPTTTPMERIMPSKHPQPISDKKRVSTPAPSSEEDIDEEDGVEKK